MLRWCMVALVAIATATGPPRLPALAVGWLALVSLYNALGHYGGDVVTGRSALRLAQGLVVADMAAMVALAAMYRGLPPANLSLGFFLVLLEALIWCDWTGVMLSIGLIGTGWVVTDLVGCLGSAPTFPWRDFLGDLLTVGVVAVALVLALRVLSATVNDGGAGADPSQAATHLAPSTVKSHVESILARLDARNRAEAVAIASRLRLPLDAGQDVSATPADGHRSALRTASLVASLNERS